MPRIFDSSEIDPAFIIGEPIAVIGYGNQGRAHALKMKQKGLPVVVGQRPGKSWDKAVEDGLDVLDVTDAVDRSNFVMLTLPDESMAEVFDSQIASVMTPEKTLLVCHGFSVHFGFLKPGDGYDVVLAAPKGSGASLLAQDLAGLVAVHRDVSGHALEKAMSYTWAIGCNLTVIHTTFEEECVTDLFGEQAVLCGGIPELIKAAFETLVEAGYSPESAYLECMHEAKLITDLLYERGLSGMRKAISDTAEWGGYQTGVRLIDETVKQRMRESLDDIRSGKFARGWVEESQHGKDELRRLRESEAELQIEDVGRKLRRQMPNVDDN